VIYVIFIVTITKNPIKIIEIPIMPHENHIGKWIDRYLINEIKMNRVPIIVKPTPIIAKIILLTNGLTTSNIIMRNF
jgi:hypothetical protein